VHKAESPRFDSRRVGSKLNEIYSDVGEVWRWQVRATSYTSDKSPTRYKNFPLYHPDVYLQLNMFWAFSCPSSGAQWLQWQPLVLLSYRGDSRAVFVVGPARPRTQHDCHHDTKVKPEVVNAVFELMMMGGKTLETCWIVNKHHDYKLKNCCIRLVIYLNWIKRFLYLHVSKMHVTGCCLVDVYKCFEAERCLCLQVT
jgi:hypothetical protein